MTVGAGASVFTDGGCVGGSVKVDAETFGATVGVGAEGELTSMTSDAGTTREGAEECAAECAGGGVPASIQTVGELWGAASTGGGCVAKEIPSRRDGSSSRATGGSASSSAPWIVEGGIEIGCAAVAEDAADADDDPKISGCIDTMSRTERFTFLGFFMKSVRRSWAVETVGDPPC